MDEIVSNFQQDMDFEQALHACAACGVGKFVAFEDRKTEYAQCHLHQLRVLQLNNEMKFREHNSALPSDADAYIAMGEYKQIASVVVPPRHKQMITMICIPSW